MLIQNQADMDALIASINTGVKGTAAPVLKEWSGGVKTEIKGNVDAQHDPAGAYWKAVGRAWAVAKVDDTAVKVQTYAPAAERTQYGGTALPLHRQFMAVPVGNWGRVKGGAWRNLHRAKRQQLYDWFDSGFLVAITSRAGNRLFVHKEGKGKNATITPMFVQKPEVYTRARPFLPTEDRMADIGAAALAHHTQLLAEIYQ